MRTAAAAQGLDWFDGFLAGTAWSMGRTALLRTLDMTLVAAEQAFLLNRTA